METQGETPSNESRDAPPCGGADAVDVTDAGVAASATQVSTVAAAAVAPCGAAALSVPLDGHNLESLLRELSELRNQVSVLQQCSDMLAARVAQGVELQQLGAEQLRRLGPRLEQVSSAVADHRLRNWAAALVLFHDLLASLAGKQDKPVEPRVLQMLLGQLRQMLAAHGIEQIPAEGRVDYGIHRAVEQVPAAGPEDDGRIVKVSRPGFRFGGQVLRPSDVVVTAYHAPPASPAAPAIPVQPDAVQPNTGQGNTLHMDG